MLDIIDTGNDLATVISALAALASGGFVVGRTAELARFRLRRRVRILEEWLPVLLEGPPSTLCGATNWKASLSSLQLNMRYMTWADNLAWSDLEPHLPGCDYVTWIDRASDIGVDASRELTRSVETALDYMRKDHEAGSGTTLANRLEAFSKHILRKVRPTWRLRYDDVLYLLPIIARTRYVQVGLGLILCVALIVACRLFS